MAELPLYKIVVNDDDETGVDFISLVDEPAIEQNFILLKKEFKFAIDTEKKILLGPLLIPDKKIFRVSEELGEYNILFEKDTIEKIVRKYNKNNNNGKINLQHNSGDVVEGFLTENWIVEDKEFDKSVKYGFKPEVGTWFGSVYIEDQNFWDNIVKTGEVKGFSVEILAGMEQILMSVESQCDRNSCNNDNDPNHNWDYVEEIMIRGELLRHEYEKQLKEGKLEFRKVKFERWVCRADELTCPICVTLNNLGWQLQGTFFRYSWNGQSKQVLMPRYREAHSEIGEGRWNADDSSCRCQKDSFTTDSNNPNLPTFPIFRLPR